MLRSLTVLHMLTCRLFDAPHSSIMQVWSGVRDYPFSRRLWVFSVGIMHPADDNALNTEERIWDLTMAINLKGVWWGCKHAILAMRNNPTDESKSLHVGGSIINTASFVAIMGAATPQLACAFSIPRTYRLC